MSRSKDVLKTCRKKPHVILLRGKFSGRNFLISLCSHRESASDWQLSGKFEENSNFGTFSRQVWTFQYAFIRIIRQRRVTNDSQRSSYFLYLRHIYFSLYFRVYVFSRVGFFRWKNSRNTHVERVHFEQERIEVYENFMWTLHHVSYVRFMFQK